MMDWDNYFMAIARTVSTRSKDESTKVGAVIVGPDHEIRSTGFNGPPRGFNDGAEGVQDRPGKYKTFEHAERNAIYNAAIFGAPLRGCTMYCLYPPCTDCARAIIQSGIIKLVLATSLEEGVMGNWKDECAAGLDLLFSCGVYVRYTKGGAV